MIKPGKVDQHCDDHVVVVDKAVTKKTRRTRRSGASKGRFKVAAEKVRPKKCGRKSAAEKVRPGALRAENDAIVEMTQKIVVELRCREGLN